MWCVDLFSQDRKKKCKNHNKIHQNEFQFVSVCDHSLVFSHHHASLCVSVARRGVQGQMVKVESREINQRPNSEAKATEWRQWSPLTPAAIMRPATMERVIGRHGVGRVAAELRVQVCRRCTSAGRLVVTASITAIVPGRFLQRQRNPLTFVT